MGKKRKRPGKSRQEHSPTARSQPRITASASPGRLKYPNPPVTRNKPNHTAHPVISLYYREVLTLRHYLLRQLPTSSKSRRRRIASLGSSTVPEHGETKPLSDLLDATLVGVLKQPSPKVDSERQRDYRAFTQSQSRSVLVSTDTGPTSPQSEVVDFVIESLFRHSGTYQRPEHLLTHGFRRAKPGQNALDNIPGLVAQFSNHNVRTLKNTPWADILGLLGEHGDEIMMRLLFDCGIFCPIDAKKGMFYQLSGLPLSELKQLEDCSSKPLEPSCAQQLNKKSKSQGGNRAESRAPNSITLLRRRMLYSGPNDRWKETVRRGLGSSHVLNRFSDTGSIAQTVHVMKYIFPRQFGLQNVFSITSRTGNTTPFNGHASREKEIAVASKRKSPQHIHYMNDLGVAPQRMPKRLRGQTVDLVRALRVRHARCSYSELLRHYCPLDSPGPWRLGSIHSPTKRLAGSAPGSSMGEKLVTQAQGKSPSSSEAKLQPGAPVSRVFTARNGHLEENQDYQSRVKKSKLSLTDYATPASSVSAFCRAVLHKLLPPRFFGDGEHGLWNRKMVMKHVDSFIKLRRYESLSLHEVCKGLKLTNISWLVPPSLQDSSSDTRRKVSLSDFQKRTELLHELIFYIFDSILIPLIRTNFYVTESQTHRYRLFYFRHDVWQRLTEQPLAELKASMFEEIDADRAERKLARRSLGCGSLRLLPKSTGIRPILNLRRRAVKQMALYGKQQTFLAKSINSTLTPVYNMLTYERRQTPDRLGFSLLSITDMHSRLGGFKKQLSQQSPLSSHKLPQLYFVKLDIQACFDTIPQRSLLQLVEGLVSQETYNITKHVEMTPHKIDERGKPLRKFLGRAAPVLKEQPIPDLVAKGMHPGKTNAVFVDTVKQNVEGADGLLDLLEEHVRNNLVKMGDVYFRQRSGIPQGSILSSLLCNFFYAELEREVLEFLRPTESLLMRLIDDFLLITTDIRQATQFLRVMLRGQPQYGVTVNPAKSLSNFTAVVDGIHVPRLEGALLFPYCGSLIDTRTLEIHHDRNRMLEGAESAAANISNALTVETSRSPGRVFNHKVLSSFRLQLQSMYLDTAHNSHNTVLANLYTSLITCAMKMYRYMKSLRGRAHPNSSIIIQTIHDLIMQTNGMIRARRASRSAPLSCFVQLSQLQYLAAAAFRFVLQRKQTRYAPVLRWLDSLGKATRPKSNVEAVRLAQVVKKGNVLFDGWRF